RTSFSGGKRGKVRGDDKGHPDGEYLKRNRWFESGSLQQRVCCEPAFLDLIGAGSEMRKRSGRPNRRRLLREAARRPNHAAEIRRSFSNLTRRSRHADPCRPRRSYQCRTRPPSAEETPSFLQAIGLASAASTGASLPSKSPVGFGLVRGHWLPAPSDRAAGSRLAGLSSHFSPFVAE